MNDKRLNYLSLMAIESDIVSKIDFDEMIDAFAKRKSRTKLFFFNVSNEILNRYSSCAGWLKLTHLSTT